MSPPPSLESLNLIAQDVAAGKALSKELIQPLFTQLLEGEEEFDFEKTRLITNPVGLKLLIDVAETCAPELQAEIWSIVLALTHNCVHNQRILSDSHINEIAVRFLSNPNCSDMLAAKLIQLIEVVSSYSLSVKELRAILPLLKIDHPAYNIQRSVQLLLALQTVATTEGCLAFFHFSGDHSAIILPSVKRWPCQSGFSFSTWVRLDRLGEEGVNPEYEPYLFTFQTAHCQGYSCKFFGGRLVVMSHEPGGRVAAQVVCPYVFNLHQWYMVTIVWTHKLLKKSEVHCYINGVESVIGHMKMVNSADPFVRCYIGMYDFKSPSSMFCGQTGSLYLFGESLPPAVVNAMYHLGPDYRNNFQYENESRIKISDQDLKLLYNGRLSSSLLFNFNPRACEGISCLESSPHNDAAFYLMAQHGSMMGDVLPIVTHSLVDCISAVGGIQILFPLLSQVSLLTSAPKATLETSLTTLLNLFSLFLCSSLTMQEQMVQINGFMILGALLQRMDSHLLQLSAVDLLLNLCLSLNNLVVLGSSVSEQLVSDLFEHVFFNMELWVRTSFFIQLRLFSRLATEIIPKIHVEVLEDIGLQRILALLFEIPAEIAEDIAPSDLEKADADARKVSSQKNSVREFLLIIIHDLLCTRGHQITLEEVEDFLDHIHQWIFRGNTSTEILHLFFRICSELPDAVLPHLRDLQPFGIIQCFLESEFEEIRIYGIRLFGFVLQGYALKEKASARKSIDFSAMVLTVAKILRSSTTSLSIASYDALFQCMIAAISTQPALRETVSVRQNAILIHHPHVLLTILELLYLGSAESLKGGANELPQITSYYDDCLPTLFNFVTDLDVLLSSPTNRSLLTPVEDSVQRSLILLLGRCFIGANAQPQLMTSSQWQLLFESTLRLIISFSVANLRTNKSGWKSCRLMFTISKTVFPGEQLAVEFQRELGTTHKSISPAYGQIYRLLLDELLRTILEVFTELKEVSKKPSTCLEQKEQSVFVLNLGCTLLTHIDQVLGVAEAFNTLLVPFEAIHKRFPHSSELGETSSSSHVGLTPRASAMNLEHTPVLSSRKSFFETLRDLRSNPTTPASFFGSNKSRKSTDPSLSSVPKDQSLGNSSDDYVLVENEGAPPLLNDPSVLQNSYDDSSETDVFFAAPTLTAPSLHVGPRPHSPSVSSSHMSQASSSDELGKSPDRLLPTAHRRREQLDSILVSDSNFALSSHHLGASLDNLSTLLDVDSYFVKFPHLLSLIDRLIEVLDDLVFHTSVDFTDVETRFKLPSGFFLRQCARILVFRAASKGIALFFDDPHYLENETGKLSEVALTLLNLMNENDDKKDLILHSHDEARLRLCVKRIDHSPSLIVSIFSFLSFCLIRAYEKSVATADASLDVEKSCSLTASLLKDMIFSSGSEGSMLMKRFVGSDGKRLMQANQAGFTSSMAFVMSLVSLEWQTALHQYGGNEVRSWIREGVDIRFTQKRETENTKGILIEGWDSQAQEALTFLFAVTGDEFAFEQRCSNRESRKQVLKTEQMYNSIRAAHAWNRILDLVTNERGVWTDGSDSSSAEHFWQLDPFEHKSRMRRRIVKNPQGSSHPEATLSFETRGPSEELVSSPPPEPKLSNCQNETKPENQVSVSDDVPEMVPDISQDTIVIDSETPSSPSSNNQDRFSVEFLPEHQESDNGSLNKGLKAEGSSRASPTIQSLDSSSQKFDSSDKEDAKLTKSDSQSALTLVDQNETNNSSADLDSMKQRKHANLDESTPTTSLNMSSLLRVNDSLSLDPTKSDNVALGDDEEDEYLPRVDQIDHRGLVGSGRVLFSSNCDAITPGFRVPGQITILTWGLMFSVSVESNLYRNSTAQLRTWLDNLNGVWQSSQLICVLRRRYMLKYTAVEIYFSDHTSLFLNFSTPQAMKRVEKLTPTAPLTPNSSLLFGLPHLFHQFRAPGDLFHRSDVTARWQNGKISNFEYLMYLNTIAGRSYNDISQYPIFPWILSNYDSPTLDLDDPSNYRDLSKPVGALHPPRLEEFLERYEMWDDDSIPKFHYGSHYSTPGYVLFWLIRLEPFTSLLLRLQSGKFDQPDRIFHSLAQTWHSCTHSTSDVKELIPELFFLPEMFSNLNHYDMGVTQADFKLGDVELPPWASTPEEFISIHRQALESEYVSRHLHEWIDLIFGYKQRGPEALEAVNVFYYLTYEGVNLPVMDPPLRAAAENQISNFGQTPPQLLSTPHPPRLVFVSPVLQSDNYTFMVYSLNQDAPIVALHIKDDEVVTVNSHLTVHTHRLVDLTCSKASLIVDPKANAGLEARKRFVDPLDQHIAVNPSCFVIQRDHKWILACGFWDQSIKRLSVESGKLLETHFGQTEVVTCISESENGEYIVTGCRNAIVYVWSWEDTRSRRGALISLLGKSSTLRQLTTCVGHEQAISCVAVNAGFNTIVSGSEGLCLVHTVRGELLYVLKHPSYSHVRNLAISSVSGDIFVYYHQEETKESSLARFSLNGKLCATSPLSGPLSTFLVTSTGEHIITGSADHVVEIRSAAFFDVVTCFPPFDGSIVSLCLTADDQMLAVGLSSGRLVLCQLILRAYPSLTNVVD